MKKLAILKIRRGGPGLEGMDLVGIKEVCYKNFDKLSENFS